MVPRLVGRACRDLVTRPAERLAGSRQARSALGSRPFVGSRMRCVEERMVTRSADGSRLVGRACRDPVTRSADRLAGSRQARSALGSRPFVGSRMRCVEERMVTRPADGSRLVGRARRDLVTRSADGSPPRRSGLSRPGDSFCGTARGISTGSIGVWVATAERLAGSRQARSTCGSRPFVGSRRRCAEERMVTRSADGSRLVGRACRDLVTRPADRLAGSRQARSTLGSRLLVGSRDLDRLDWRGCAGVGRLAGL
ncbi:hypothetical protein PA27867_2395 [Cryobacterium arcticum]|uniref:Uncharacterized protein n=1 Tax=Cryobacterium arcticum TaxID=670052 RepID=A0A1B1BL60_9MICO|nr:hypothetical protein PA27867_2395 [Cryobacterium arcticum]